MADGLDDRWLVVDGWWLAVGVIDGISTSRASVTLRSRFGHASVAADRTWPVWAKFARSGSSFRRKLGCQRLQAPFIVLLVKKHPISSEDGAGLMRVLIRQILS
jgi:hypothetical protein